jgi:glycine cleavage system aminomethyltransferase T
MLKRVSPVDMGLKAERVLVRNGWEIPLAYAAERSKSALFAADLSHVPKWTLQGPDLDAMHPAGLSMPAKPGMIALERGLLLVRCIPGESRIMALGDELPSFEETGFTDVTDAYAAVAIVGTRCFDVLAKLSPVDLEGPFSPKAAQAPVEDLTCLLVHIEGTGGVPGIILAGARGYGHFFIDALLDAGREYSIQAAGWERFSQWIAGASVAVEPASDPTKARGTRSGRGASSPQRRA